MGRKVLVVDDEKLIVKGLRFSLEQDDMEVDCAYDGEEALEMAKRKEYDMILLDVILSGKWNCCKEIYYEAAKRDAAIGMATVYRMVSTLEEIGVFSRCYRYSLPDRPWGEEQAGD